jgi:hypothetical protein
VRSSVKDSKRQGMTELIDRTREVWQPRLGRDLTPDEAKQIAANVTGFFAVLAEWSRAEDVRPSQCTVTAAPPAMRRCAMTAETIAKALGGRKVGQGWTARCPAHDDREPSLSIRDADGKVLVRCHAGCDQRDVIAALRTRPVGRARSMFAATGNRVAARCRRLNDPIRIIERGSASRFRSGSVHEPAAGTPVEAYLASRGLSCSCRRLLRFHAG